MGPGPGLGDFDFPLRWPRTRRAAVQDAVAQCLGLGAGQGPVQAQQPQPAQQVGRDGGGQASCLVDLVGLRR